MSESDMGPADQKLRVEEYDPTTGANESVIDRGLAVGLDSASIGFLCIDGEVRLSLYQDLMNSSILIKLQQRVPRNTLHYKIFVKPVH